MATSQKDKAAEDLQRQRQARIILAQAYTNREGDSAKDSLFINCFPEAIENHITNTKRVYLQKRPGSAEHSAPSAAAEGRGLFYWEKTGKVYSVFGNKLYANTTEIKTLNTSTGKVGWTDTMGATDYLMLVDGTDGWLIDNTDTVTEIVDADFPSPHVPQPIFLDSYIFLINTTTGEVYNSEDGTPGSWLSTDFFTPEVYPDKPVALAKSRNYLVTLGSASVEFFYDTAQATGSPLSRNDSVVIRYGCAAANTVAWDENMIIFVAQAPSGGKCILMLDDFKDQEISTETINRMLDGEGDNITSAEGALVRIKGHLMYVLHLNDHTMVYDIKEKVWHEWKSKDGSNQVRFAGRFFTYLPPSKLLYQHRTNGKIYNMAMNYYQDGTDNIRVVCQTVPWDMESLRRKFIYRAELAADRTTTSCTVDIQYSDDDYNTWSTARQVNLMGRPFLKQLGSTRRRAWKITHESNHPFRAESLELDFDMGSY